jgi:hypothetical protein
MSGEMAGIVRQLLVDEKFRAQVMAAPRKRLSDLGFPTEVVESLIPVLMATFAAGGIILSEVDPLYTPIGWR